LVVRRGMIDIDQIQDIIMHWADRCSELTRLNPSRCDFANRVRSRIYELMEERIPPMRPDTFKERNPKLHERLNSEGMKIRVEWLAY
jgi:hypothetical protein